MHQDDTSPTGERIETLHELSDLLRVLQEMCRRLGNETHGADFDDVRVLNDYIHQARALVEQMQARAPLR